MDINFYVCVKAKMTYLSDDPIPIMLNIVRRHAILQMCTWGGEGGGGGVTNGQITFQA